MQEKPLRKFFWFWVPIALIGAQVLIELFVPSQFLAALHSEQGPHETLQVLIIVAAFFVAIVTFIKMNHTVNPWISALVGVAALCCLYVGGEELSWGQHLIGWATPEHWMDLNDQGETNLHNTSSWLDQKPRLILLIGIVIGGLIIPALQKFRSRLLPEKFAIIYPPVHLFFIAFCALAVNLVDKVDEALKDVVVMERASEVEEIFLFYFVLLYLISLRRRIMQHKR